MTRLSRPIALRSAAILSFLLGVYAIVLVLPLIFRGAVDVDQAFDAPPYGVIVSAFAFAIVRITGAYGTWQKQRWGIILTILANAFDGMLAAPGIVGAPTRGWQIAAASSVIGSVVVIVLCLWRDPRPLTT